MQIWKSQNTPPSTDYIWIRLNNDYKVVGYFKYEGGKWVLKKEEELKESTGGSNFNGTIEGAPEDYDTLPEIAAALDNLSDVAFSGNYTDLSNTPSNKQSVYTGTLESVTNPQEGDICIVPAHERLIELNTTDSGQSFTIDGNSVRFERNEVDFENNVYSGSEIYINGFEFYSLQEIPNPFIIPINIGQKLTIGISANLIALYYNVYDVCPQTIYSYKNGKWNIIIDKDLLFDICPIVYHGNWTTTWMGAYPRINYGVDNPKMGDISIVEEYVSWKVTQLPITIYMDMIIGDSLKISIKENVENIPYNLCNIKLVKYSTEEEIANFDSDSSKRITVNYNSFESPYYYDLSKFGYDARFKLIQTTYENAPLAFDYLDISYVYKPKYFIFNGNDWVQLDFSIYENANNKTSDFWNTLTYSDKSHYPSLIGVYDAINPKIISGINSTIYPEQLINLGTISSNKTIYLSKRYNLDNDRSNHYYFTFDIESTLPTITWPSGITWVSGSAPEILANTHYEISILNNVATYLMM